MREIIVKYWVEFVCGTITTALCLACKRLYSEVKKSRCQSETLKEGMTALLRSELIKDYNKYMEKGEMPIYAKENVEDICKAYHNLGGNGVGTKMYEELMSLPTEKAKVHENG